MYPIGYSPSYGFMPYTPRYYPNLVKCSEASHPTCETVFDLKQVLTIEVLNDNDVFYIKINFIQNPTPIMLRFTNGEVRDANKAALDNLWTGDHRSDQPITDLKDWQQKMAERAEKARKSEERRVKAEEEARKELEKMKEEIDARPEDPVVVEEEMDLSQKDHTLRNILILVVGIAVIITLVVVAFADWTKL